MRRLLRQGLPETLLFIVVLYLLVFLRSSFSGEELQEILEPQLFPHGLIYLILGFAAGIPPLVKRASREGLGLNWQLLLLPGLVVAYVALLPHLLETLELNLPVFRLEEHLTFASRSASVWLGILLSRALERPQERSSTYLHLPPGRF